MSASKPLLVLVHGWGFDPSVWDSVLASPRLSGVDVERIDLGFAAVESPNPVPGGPDEAGAVLLSSRELPVDRPLIGVGHSVGFAWLLRQPVAWRGLVSINGFARFTRTEDFPEGVPARLLERMIVRLQADPQGVARDFLRRCGVEAPEVERLHPAALAEGLQWLARWDLRGALAAWSGPLLALAAEDDPIVPAAMSLASFPASSLRIEEGGGHLLPRTRAGRCAEAIADFLDDLGGPR